MSASNRPSGPAKPQNEQREVVTDREGLDELALQQAPVDDGDVADSDEFAVAEAIGDVQPGGEDDSGTPSAPGADRPAWVPGSASDRRSPKRQGRPSPCGKDRPRVAVRR